jgi:uncharacterized membrane protein YozB (DUF420 family)
MTTLFFHFAAGIMGSLLLFLFFAKLAGEEPFSFPSAVVVVGFYCALLSHFLSPWATPVILAIYAVINAHELRQHRAVWVRELIRIRACCQLSQT